MFYANLNRFFAVLLFLSLVLGNVQLEAQEPTPAPSLSATSYIVQGKDIASAISAVKKVGGKIASDFNIIRAINAKLTQAQLVDLQKTPGVTVYEDQQANTSTTGMNFST